MSRVSKRLSQTAESATLKLNALVKDLQTQGRDIINLTAGEPDFNVPEKAKDAAIQAIRDNKSKYTPAAGISELRELIAKKTNLQQPALAKKNPWKASHVVVTNGGKHSLFNALMALIDPGDEVIIPAPYWLSYPEMVGVSEGKSKIITTTRESGYKLTPDQLKNALSSKTKALIINSPSNPTGAMYSKEDLSKLGRVLLEHPQGQNVWVLSDEIYDRIVYGKTPFCSFLEAVPELQDRCITLNSLSKSAAMTGWRVGWSVAPSDLTQAMAALQGQSTSGINSVAQWASVAALKISDEEFSSQVETFRRRKDLVLEILAKSGKIIGYEPEGAFYAFIGVQACLRKGEDAVGFCERLLQEAGVALVPGTPFGDPGSVRLSFATSEKLIQEGCVRLVQFAEKSTKT